MESGKIKTLFTDVEKTEALFPRTKTSAVSDNNGVGLDALLADKASQSFVTNKIAEAQLGGGGSGGNIDLSGYATKDDIKNIDYPVDSVNGKTGDVQLSAADVGAAPAWYGLGDTSNMAKVTAWGDLNIAIIPGWYKVTFNTWYTGEHLLRVDATDNTVVQTFIHTDASGKISIGKRSRLPSGSWGDLVDCSPSAFAPSGYGLGGYPKWVASMDNIYDDGWYQCDLGSMGYFVGIVTRYNVDGCIQHMWSINTASDGSLKEIQRHIVGGVAQPWVYCSPNNFAPAGYGLGLTTPTAITTTEELDATRKCGFYRYNIANSVICGISFSSASMIVYSNTANSCVQELRPHKTNYCLRRNYVGGSTNKWSAWELVGGVRKLLWENASLESTFDAQKIELDLSDYDGVEVVTYADATTNVYLNSGFIRKGLQGVFQYMYATQSYRLTRTFTVDDTGVDFATATNTGTLAVNKLAKPFIIYGVKGVK